MRKVGFFGISVVNLAAFLVFVITCQNAWATNLLTNGSFETGDFQGWTYSGNVVVASTGQLATDGIHSCWWSSGQTDPTGQISQAFVTIPNNSYRLTFDYATYGGVVGSQELRILINGSSLILSQDISLNISHSQFYPYSFDFVADNSWTSLTFKDITVRAIDMDGLLDNVRVEALPEPCTLVLLGLGGLLLSRKKQITRFTKFQRIGFSE